MTFLSDLASRNHGGVAFPSLLDGVSIEETYFPTIDTEAKPISSPGKHEPAAGRASFFVGTETTSRVALTRLPHKRSSLAAAQMASFRTQVLERRPTASSATGPFDGETER